MQQEISDGKPSASTIHFLGCGNAHSMELGNSSAVFEQGDCLLCIDMGFTAYHAYKDRYKALPEAVFITHGHLDHIGGLENLFFDAYFNAKSLVKLFVPVSLVSLIHKKLASIEHALAEGNANFWDAFQLVPVEEAFWYRGLKFTVFENRHHQPGFSYGLALSGKFLYSGDTKPIPEVINFHASNGELIFHDLSLTNQPSHTFVDELTCYTKNVLSRCWFYHLSNADDVQQCEERGFNVVKPNQTFTL